MCQLCQRVKRIGRGGIERLCSQQQPDAYGLADAGRLGSLRLNVRQWDRTCGVSSLSASASDLLVTSFNYLVDSLLCGFY
mmetsp:Transcript_33513/g.61885  ORF Transcript_33513/g.61885 Transcript_33513/m.61885 type:complete len:80 (-) Transcript_33513:23-262(-)